MELPMLTGAPNGLAFVGIERMRDVRAAPALNCYRVDHSFSPLGGWRSAGYRLISRYDEILVFVRVLRMKSDKVFVAPGYLVGRGHPALFEKEFVNVEEFRLFGHC